MSAVANSTIEHCAAQGGKTRKGLNRVANLASQFTGRNQDQCAWIQSELEDQLRLKTNLRYDLEICGCGSLPRYEVKAKRFKDLRSKKTE